MFAYKTLKKDENVATIKLINNQEKTYVPAKQARNEDYSDFTL